MSFDKPTRNRLAKFVSDARGVIADEFTEQFQSLYGISAKGDIAPLEKLGHLDEAGMATAALLRERIEYLEKTHPDDKDGTKAAVARLAREQAFTILNRLAAIRMAEKRGLIVESVGLGYQSKGFKVFETVAGSALGDTFHRYRRYLFCLFDELAIDLGILFDRRSPQALLFPREPALLALLDLLHASDLERLWAEDETIGWIYQYYNDPEERKKMRKESAAPRNSRELAVRNQFFTPRYVVEFLTDNTLGRIWYEMTKGKTSLKDCCRYLVRRPIEVFLVTPTFEKFTLEKNDWISEVALSGNFSSLPENPTIKELAHFALLVEGYDLMEMLELSAYGPQEAISRFIDRVCNRQLEASEKSPQPWQGTAVELWCALFIIQRKRWRECSLNGGNGKSYEDACASDDFAARDIWPVLRHALQHPAEELSQEELLRQPVHILHCPLKDPREIRLLDPACGSMHFGLYAFDLFEIIYEEAWNNGFCPALRESYASKEEFIRDVPRLIIEHNIHGIDIDPRATQIAALSLWLRAQKAWQGQKVTAADRPRVRRSNIVCAEPMPGSPEMLDEFVATLNPPLIGELVMTVFDKMQLAGEAGSLLKIEEEIRTAIDTARKEWLKQQDDLLTRKDGSQEDFFDTAEQQVIDALRAYAEQADADSYQRRLFADDAARGFAFIDLCRKRYDAVVMNPPFGEASEVLLTYLLDNYEAFNRNLLCAFIVRTLTLGRDQASVGAIYDRTALVKSTYEEFRLTHLLRGDRLQSQCDLGWEVLDANVETTASVIRVSPSLASDAVFIDVRSVKPDLKGNDALDAICAYSNGSALDKLIVARGSIFRKFPNAVVGYDFPTHARRSFSEMRSLSSQTVTLYEGHTLKSEVFFRYWWEVPLSDAFIPGKSWQRLYNGGDYQRFVSPLCDACLYGSNGSLTTLHPSTILRNLPLQQHGKLGFGKRGEFMDAHVVPPGFVSTVEGKHVNVDDSCSPFVILALLNSHLFQSIINLYCGQHKYPGYVGIFPAPELTSNKHLESAGAICEEIYTILRSFEAIDEISPFFFGADPKALFDRTIHQNASDAINTISVLESKMNDAVAQAYQLSISEQTIVSGVCSRIPEIGGWAFRATSLEVDSLIVSYIVGTAFGRWDIRYATCECKPPELSAPFDPLPVCPPGVLQNSKGLPAEPNDVPADYPLRISWSGILVDDENHRNKEGHCEDIVARVREAIEVIWKDRAEAIEQEVCEILGVKNLRDYFRRPAAFFTDHLKRYSKSRRQAPIYWPLSTKSGSYTLWLYYHRLTDQTLHTCLADFLDPKIRKVQSELDALTNSGGGGTRAGELREFLDELKDLHDEIERVIKLPWKPNLNDGVLITASPLHKLFRLPRWQRDLKACWDKLAKGEYDWAHLAYTIWPSRVEKACEKDRSIAIAHGLEHLCKVQAPKAKKRGKKAEEEEPEEEEPLRTEED